MSTSDNDDLVLKSIILSNDPLAYEEDQGLKKAFEIAVALGKPLLISGEPGTGKTKFAHWAARKLAAQPQNDACPFLPDPFVFPVKSTSQAADLFYNYDAVGHFRSNGGPAQPYITLRALGQALAYTHEASAEALAALKGIRNLRTNNEATALPDDQPRSSVVLIDEVDKAPREFPNDLLHEIDTYSCWIPELACALRRSDNPACRIAIILTSNSEKNLPNAFLRRCVFYHINFPDRKQLLKIAKLKLDIKNAIYDARIDAAINEFMNLRNGALNKKPTTSEFLDWLSVLIEHNLLDDGGMPPPVPDNSPNHTDEQKAAYALYKASMSTLLKTTEDLRAGEPV